jgi:hypothetical protein
MTIDQIQIITFDNVTFEVPIGKINPRNHQLSEEEFDQKTVKFFK